MPQPIYLSRDGLEKLRKEIDYLRTVRRHDVTESIQLSRERGGTVSNAEYEEARNDLAFTEGRILTLENLINNAMIIEESRGSWDTVEVGATVTVQDPSRADPSVQHHRKRRSGPCPGENIQRFPHRQESAGQEAERGRRGQRAVGKDQIRDSGHRITPRTLPFSGREIALWATFSGPGSEAAPPASESLR